MAGLARIRQNDPRQSPRKRSLGAQEAQAKSLIKSENRVEGVVMESKDLGELELWRLWSLTHPVRIALPLTRKSGWSEIPNLRRLPFGLYKRKA